MPIWRTPEQIASPKVHAFDAYWRARRPPDGGLPRRSDIEPAELRALLPHILIADFQADPLEVRYRLIGTKIVEMSRIDFTGKRLADCDFQAEDPGIWRRAYDLIARTVEPVYGRIDIPPAEGTSDRRVTEEFGIFPLSLDGRTVAQCIALEDYDAADPRVAPEDLRPMRVR